MKHTKTRSHIQTQLHTQYTHIEGALHEEMSRFHPPSQNQTGLGSGVWQIVFLSAKVQTSKNLPMCGKCLSISTLSLRPSPLVNSCHSPSSLCVYLKLIWLQPNCPFLKFARKTWIPGLSPSQAELNTAPKGTEECVTTTLMSQGSEMLPREQQLKIQISATDGAPNRKHIVTRILEGRKNDDLKLMAKL